MAYSDATRVDANTARITTIGVLHTDVRNAVKTFGNSMETVMTNYELNAKDQQAFRDKVIDLCRFLDAAMQ